ncbi:phosphoribosylglycinamide formyltransferase [Paenibacillus sp. 1011MAR3C5]|uniref:phosphoribosylglycinamide formyltransferase n=1 Tax=Paenibacillus sp. 1011MAR3C5 TaxID=1675787 RepID=UPI000E6D383E|nr:phosphoribosylglycinamide formyltransferase [Paenibacillus sp. 1011MAR3C5]RJE88688.1 phosphoribosylglycinamide formyltransferase [Paenibacillus sp. 1011MAR3C5]
MAALRIAIFASGQGTNFQTIADAVREGKLDVTIELLVCDKPSAPVIERASQAGVDAFVFKPKDYPSREAYESEILEELRARQVDLVVLAGYMRILTPTLVEPFMGRMINIHPSLLPSFPGINAIGQALEHGVKVTGVTVHYVDGGLDSGPIIAQTAVEVTEEDDEASLTVRIQQAERELYPEAIKLIAQGAITIEGRRVAVGKSQ